MSTSIVSCFGAYSITFFPDIFIKNACPEFAVFLLIFLNLTLVFIIDKFWRSYKGSQNNYNHYNFSDKFWLAIKICKNVFITMKNFFPNFFWKIQRTSYLKISYKIRVSNLMSQSLFNSYSIIIKYLNILFIFKFFVFIWLIYILNILFILEYFVHIWIFSSYLNILKIFW